MLQGKLYVFFPFSCSFRDEPLSQGFCLKKMGKALGTRFRGSNRNPTQLGYSGTYFVSVWLVTTVLLYYVADFSWQISNLFVFK